MDPALNIGFDNAEGRFVPLDGHHQCVQHPSRRPLSELNRNLMEK
jgi:hypothetical protein